MYRNFITHYCLPAVISLISANLYSQTIDSSFSANLDVFGLNGANVINVQSDDKVLIQTNYAANSNGARYNLARLNANGSLDMSFNSAGSVASDEIKFAKQLSDGKILVSGTFTRFNGSAYKPKGMLRLNSDGSVDNTFQSAFQNMSIDFVVAFAVNLDGSIIAAWRAFNYGSMRISKFNADGSLDNSFNCALSVYQYVRGIAIQPDGKFLVYGESSDGGNQSLLKRFNANGSDDATFNASVKTLSAGFSGISRLTLLPSTDMVISGTFNNCNGSSCRGLAMLTSSGSLASGFNPSYDFMTPTGYSVDDHLVLNDGKILLSGVFLSYIVLINTDGTTNDLLTNLTGNVNEPHGGPMHLAQGSNNKIYVAGLTQVQGVPCPSLARIDQNFNYDFTFAIDPFTNESATVTSVRVQNDLKVVVGGKFNYADKVSRNSIARLNTDGSVDQTFNPGTGIDGAINDILVQPDGKIVVAGSFDHVNQEIHNNIVRLNANGSIDQSFVVDESLFIYNQCKMLALQSDGKILVERQNGGHIEIIRLNLDGGKDGTFTTITLYGGDASYTKFPIGIQSDGKILVYSQRFNADGTTDNSFNTPSGNSFGLIEASGDIIMLNYTGTYSYGLVRVSPSGSVKEYLFDGYPANNITALYLQPNKKVLISTEYWCCTSGDVLPFTFRMNTDGSVDKTFVDNGLAPRDRVAIVGQGVDQVLLAGPSDYVNYTLRKPIVRIKTQTLTAQTISFPQPPDETYDGTPIVFNINASSSAGLDVQLEVQSGPAIINGNTITINGTGKISVKATQAGNPEYYSAVPVVKTFYSRQQQTVSFPLIDDQVFNNAPILISLGASSDEGLAITYTVISGNASVSGNSLTVTGPGKIVIKATQPGDDNYFASAATQSFYAKQNQTIDFPAVFEVDADSFPYEIQLKATTSSGLSVTYEVVSGSAQVNNDILKITGNGPVSVKASQAGNDFFLAASPQTNNVVVKQTQLITFNSISDVTYEGSPLQVILNATSSSGLPVQFSIAEGSATLNEIVLQILQPGKIRIKANQLGNDSYSPALNVEQSFFAKENQEIDFPVISATTFESNLTINLNASSSSNLPVNFLVISGSAVINSNVLSVASAGPIKIEATQGGNDLFFAATSVSQIFCINPPTPVINAQGAVLTSSSDSNNQWYKDGIAIPGATNQSYTFTEAATYSVQINVGGCLSGNSQLLIITGIEDIQSEIVVFPNPTKTEFQIKMDSRSFQVASLKMYDLKGQELSIKPTIGDAYSYKIDLSAYSNGLYLLRVTGSDGTIISKKIAKE